MGGIQVSIDRSCRCDLLEELDVMVVSDTKVDDDRSLRVDQIHGAPSVPLRIGETSRLAHIFTSDPFDCKFVYMRTYSSTFLSFVTG
jgi:hypothetical protein